MTWTVYMLRCADNSLYTGITKEIARRLIEHNTDDKKGARYTRSRRPVQLVYEEQCEDRADASRREYALKRLTRQQKLLLLQRAKN